MSDFLEHYGIKGQKWGVRRFQNKDGSRTKEGKRRLAENGKTTQSRSKLSEKDRIKRMSDDELRARLNRLRMEREYASLTSNDSAKKGFETFATYAKGFGTVAGIVGTAVAIKKNLDTVMQWFQKK